MLQPITPQALKGYPYLRICCLIFFETSVFPPFTFFSLYQIGVSEIDNTDIFSELFEKIFLSIKKCAPQREAHPENVLRIVATQFFSAREIRSTKSTSTKRATVYRCSLFVLFPPEAPFLFRKNIQNRRNEKISQNRAFRRKALRARIACAFSATNPSLLVTHYKNGTDSAP